MTDFIVSSSSSKMRTVRGFWWVYVATLMTVLGLSFFLSNAGAGFFERVELTLGSPLSTFTSPEQQNTLAFLRGLASTIPDLQSSWTGDNYCSWAEVHCRGGGVVVDLAEVHITAPTASLPELGADVDGAEVAVTHLYLYHQGTKLRGSLPASWGRLRRLVSLILIDNALSGTLPEAWGTTGGMASLRSVMLSLNAFSGTLPPSWAAVRSLKTIIVAGNQLEGPLPPVWGDMPVLFLVDVSGNQLCGCMPREWSTKKALKIRADAAVVAANCSSANACTSSAQGD